MRNSFTMVDGLDFDGPEHVRLDEVTEGTLTRGYNGTPKYQHPPGMKWELVATPRFENDDLGVDKLGERLAWLNVGEVYVDTEHPIEEAELIQITSLKYVGP